jgi:hypothetical protein
MAAMRFAGMARSYRSLFGFNLYINNEFFCFISGALAASRGFAELHWRQSCLSACRYPVGAGHARDGFRGHG